MAIAEEDSSSVRSRADPKGVYYLAKCVLRGSVVLQAVQGHIRSPSYNDIVFGKPQDHEKLEALLGHHITSRSATQQICAAGGSKSPVPPDPELALGSTTSGRSKILEVALLIEAPFIQLPDPPDPELGKCPISMASFAFLFYASMKQIRAANGSKNLDLAVLVVFREDFIVVVTGTSAKIDSLFLFYNDWFAALVPPPWPPPRFLVHLEKMTFAIGRDTRVDRMMGGMWLHRYACHYCHVHAYT
ncbi:hypothetical protein Scep_004079 [Stephania cephalantha]|uniref:Uncharacterized protein n=1 Tax=Stephania cephalantha TaxID=152367 RepID=A0AAP0KSP0_9MAGN